MYRRAYSRKRKLTTYRRRRKVIRRRRAIRRIELKSKHWAVQTEVPVNQHLTSEPGGGFRGSYRCWYTGPSSSHQSLLAGSTRLEGFSIPKGLDNNEYIGSKINLIKSKAYWQFDVNSTDANWQLECRFICFKVKRGLTPYSTVQADPDLDLLHAPGRGYDDDAIGPTAPAVTDNDFMTCPVNKRLYTCIYDRRFQIHGGQRFSEKSAPFKRITINLPHNKQVQMNDSEIANYNTMYQFVVFVRPVGRDLDTTGAVEASCHGFTYFTDP